MRHRRAWTVTLLAALAVSVIATAAPVPAAGLAPVNPPPLPHVEPLITEGVTIEGPLVNSVALPHLL
ncbi:hypothetical protein [Streptomyces sp. BA2]|uniref:hypothetical protein n=1 Tax=Streptomyces sp. BA2 TaxID=436595 RepID=UPI001321389E|nr:hypothetical protein [Streptomyces sp. BA2]MWA13981.1 hypothetical protein [Streptomyces sp. BA2]